MENGDKPVELLEMAAVKNGNHIHVVDDIDWRISQINCLYLWQFVNYYPTILNCHFGGVAF